MYRVLLPGSTMRLCFASSPPIHASLAASGFRPLRPCLSSRQDAADICSSTGDAVSNGSTAASPTSSCRVVPWSSLSSPSSSQKKKKQQQQQQQQQKSVVWSDSRGLSLTTVHLFKEFSDHLHLHLSDLEVAAAALRLSDQQGVPAPEAHHPSLLLDFPQPAADYLDFRNRLQAQLVCLENCQVQEHSMCGTVKVRNISFQKKVFVRTTFDSWISSEDVACSFLNNVYGSKETDTFSFSLELKVCQQVEFCVCYEAGEQTFWDNNHGNNYCLLPSNCETESSASVEVRTEGGASKSKTEMAFDALGSPRTLARTFPEWQSLGRIENHTYYW